MYRVCVGVRFYSRFKFKISRRNCLSSFPKLSLFLILTQIPLFFVAGVVVFQLEIQVTLTLSVFWFIFGVIFEFSLMLHGVLVFNIIFNYYQVNLPLLFVEVFISFLIVSLVMSHTFQRNFITLRNVLKDTEFSVTSLDFDNFT